MTDTNTTVEDLKKQILTFAQERDWLQFHSPKNISMALSAEAAELMEHFLWDNAEESACSLEDSAKKAAVAEELADVVIYALEFANVTGIDLAQAIKNKIALNAQKYPVEKAKGNSSKYSEL